MLGSETVFPACETRPRSWRPQERQGAGFIGTSLKNIPAKVRSGREDFFMHLIPQSWAHLHILVSVFPSFGLVIVLGFYLTGFLADNDGIKRTCLVLFAMLALLSIPTFFSGQGAMAVLSANPKISKIMMNFHYWWGVAALVVLIMTGV